MKRRAILFITAIAVVFATFFVSEHNNRILVKYIWQDYNADNSWNTLFVGSSTIARWQIDTLDNCLPAQARGFHNGLISDAARYIWLRYGVLKQLPENVILYLAENDIHSGITSTEAFTQTKSLVDDLLGYRVKRIQILLVKPSPARMPSHEEFAVYNRLLQQHFSTISNVVLIPLDQIQSHNFYLSDGIHLNSMGYSKLDGWVNAACEPFTNEQ